MENKLAILVVEDDLRIGRLLENNLRLGDTYLVDWETSAAAAQRAVRQRRAHERTPYSVVFLDLGLPDRDGLDLIPWFRTQSADQVIIVVSARGNEADKIQAFQLGADDYLTKPFHYGELMARLQAHLRRVHVTTNEGAIVRGEWRLDDNRRVLVIGEREILLTNKEYQLMRILLRNCGTIVPSKRILNAIWGHTHEEHTHYVRIYVQRLREKIESDASLPQFLLTELGIGYRLVVPDFTEKQSKTNRD
ncbi:MAG: response regulator transcription factor [Acidithiobacillus caldus]|uniref:DNA-binding response regulator KdpE n=2 Tax=Acidithiobacillus caldus TaxID=33059 RepID=A0A060A3B7_ACICK|nr:response regulator transcription factor [Acidithiobacillus caldus]AIA56691.1 DNA-binding response regulator KdpE [Acidithiobacillus caldus ATCC 51756]MBU2734719.1 response regulator transcription factor [Acidithiobacillus caldus ATCC 51756]OFC36889.1 DNA-binding response regulator [Acidithiobacillus caldus]OFC39920.1 DNA-binding response regulator [Acidithiobacillus caldus]WMT46202.1 MAG: response regulator transcription factor [Acidithiobacillus caldus]